MFEFGLKDAIDILLVAMMLFYAWRLMKSSGSLNVFYGIMVFVIIWIVVSQMLEMKLLGSIFDKLVSVVCWHSSFFSKRRYADSSLP